MDMSVQDRYHRPMPGVINRIAATVGLADGQPHPTPLTDQPDSGFYAVPRSPDDEDYVGKHRPTDQKDVVDD